MGLFTRLRTAAPVPAGPPVELPSSTLASAADCLAAGSDVGSVTQGTGRAHYLTVVGTSYRPEALAWLCRPGRVANLDKLPAVVLREPGNQHDSNAIRVLVEGVHIGFLSKSDAKTWQPVLREAERRGLHLTGAVRVLPDAGQGLGACLHLRDSLPGFEGPVTKRTKATAAKVAQGKTPIALEPTEREEVCVVLDGLGSEREARDKKRAGFVVKRARVVIARLRQHAAAMEQQQAGAAEQLTDCLETLEAELEELLEAADANDREDCHMAVQASCEELAAALRDASA